MSNEEKKSFRDGAAFTAFVALMYFDLDMSTRTRTLPTDGDLLKHLRLLMRALSGIGDRMSRPLVFGTTIAGLLAGAPSEAEKHLLLWLKGCGGLSPSDSVAHLVPVLSSVKDIVSKTIDGRATQEEKSRLLVQLRWLIETLLRRGAESLFREAA
jgi:hypothetical protein